MHFRARLPAMPHNYKRLPPLWLLEEKLELTDEHPSGLRILKNKKFVQRQDKSSGFYMVSIDSETYLAHRIVYYMRTGECPDRCSVKHGYSNKAKDNRLELVACRQPPTTKRKPSLNWD